MTATDSGIQTGQAFVEIICALASLIKTALRPSSFNKNFSTVSICSQKVLLINKHFYINVIKYKNSPYKRGYSNYSSFAFL